MTRKHQLTVICYGAVAMYTMPCLGRGEKGTCRKCYVRLPYALIVVAAGHADAFKQAGTALEVEDHPMLVEFESRGGGRPGQKSGPRHLTGRVHQYLVAHQPTTGNDVRFTCHTNVTSLNVNGAGSSTGPCVNLMKDVPFENALSAFPQRLLAFSIAR